MKTLPADVAGLPDRIMTAIARASSKRPTAAGDVCALLHADETKFWPALEDLLRSGRINIAFIQRPAADANPWLAIWPTGVVLRRERMNGSHLSSLFISHDTAALKKAHAPRSRSAAPGAVR